MLIKAEAFSADVAITSFADQLAGDFATAEIAQASLRSQGT